MQLAELCPRQRVCSLRQRNLSICLLVVAHVWSVLGVPHVRSLLGVPHVWSNLPFTHLRLRKRVWSPQHRMWSLLSQHLPKCLLAVPHLWSDRLPLGG